ncbi:MAG: type transport system ATP-binding protein [Pseudonocardiales bacterium]|jgi:ABC-2 type transport system ATP-binding protein|nr:type transport system ATP-binding protein [Pseudonocardiales bacterium]
MCRGLAGTAPHIQRVGPDTLQVSGTDSATIGRIAAREAIPLIELTPQQATLEEAFMEMTRDAVEFHGGAADSDDPLPAPAAGLR